MLTGKQKRQLRALANNLKAIYQIGKEGLSDNFIEGIDLALENHELIKISVLKTCSIDTKELAFDLSHSTSSELVQIIGRTIIVYRKTKKNIIGLQ